MKAIITPEEAARLDKEASDPVAVLMERAGLGVALTAVELGAGYGSRVVVLAGEGNNGGDGYVAARHLVRRGASVVVQAAGAPRSDEAKAARRAAEQAGAVVVGLGPPTGADLVIDALYGAGFHGSLSALAATWTSVDALVLAVDVPSGLDAATGTVAGVAFTADKTVTFHAYKTGHFLAEGPDRSGDVVVVDIGLAGGHPELLLCEAEDAPRPVRSRSVHKWSAGSVIVVGGSPGIGGAAMLTAQAALAAGAGAAAIACPGGLQASYAGSPGVMTRGIGSRTSFDSADITGILEAAGRFDVMALGPGLGSVPEYLVAELLQRWDKPLVLDADGLNALDGIGPLRPRSAPTVLTPHAGEFARLTGWEPTVEQAARLADQTGTAVVLKGSPTFVLGPERWVVTTGGPELATIGTGDVLTGMIAAYRAGGLADHVAARSAAYHHGEAGKRLASRQTVTAEGLVAEVGRR